MAPKFQGVDFYDVDSLLSEEERAVRDTVRAWVDENLIPIIGEHYIEGRFPKQLVPQMAELGLFGANLPEEYGCAGLNNVAYGLIMQELERGDSGVRSFASVQGALAMYPIYAFGSDEQKRRWLPKMASGEVIGCFGLTEPDYGSNPAGMITVAKETKDGWVLNGAKMWITNGSTAQIAVVWAKAGKVNDVESIRGSRPRTRRASCPYARATRARSSSRTCACPRMPCCPSRAASRRRSCVSPKPDTGSRGARWARRWRVSTKRRATRRRA